MLSSPTIQKELIDKIESTYGTPITPSQISAADYILKNMKFSEERLIELFCQCSNSNIRSKDSIINKAEEWKKNKVQSAKEILPNEATEVINKCGLSGKLLSEKERDILKKWFSECKFSEEQVLEACQKTVDMIGHMNIIYADKVLKSSSTINTANITSKKAAQPGETNKNANKAGRKYDYEQLEKELLGK